MVQAWQTANARQHSGEGRRADQAGQTWQAGRADRHNRQRRHIAHGTEPGTMSKTFCKRFSGQRFAGCKAGRMANQRHTVAGSTAAPTTPHGEPWRQMSAMAQAGFCAFAVCASLGAMVANGQRRKPFQRRKSVFGVAGVLRFAAHTRKPPTIPAVVWRQASRAYIRNSVGVATFARALPLKKIFLNPPLGGFTQPEKPAFFRNRLKSVLCF